VAGEKLELLNGQTTDLAPDMLVIADANDRWRWPASWAGSRAAWKRTRPMYSWKRLSLRLRQLPGARGVWDCRPTHRTVSSAASISARPAGRWSGATELLLEICGGQAGPISETVAALPSRDPITLRLARLKRVVGIEIDADQVERDLLALGAQVERQDDRLIVTPPSFRFDLAIEEDLIEEAVRLFGYDNIPAQPPAAPSRMLRRTKRCWLTMSCSRWWLTSIIRKSLPTALSTRRGDRARCACASAAAGQSHRQPAVGDAHHPVGRHARNLRHNLNRQQERCVFSNWDACMRRLPCSR